MSSAPETEQNQQPNRREPAINLPGSVLALLGLLVAVHLAREVILNEAGDQTLQFWLAFIPFRFIAGQEDPSLWLPLLWTPFTYALIHAGWMHLLINCVWLAAFGTPVAQRYGGWQMIVLFFICSAAGAALYAIFPSGGILVGASGGIAGLTAAACRFIFQPLVVYRDPETGAQRVLGRRLATLAQLTRDNRAGIFILIWLVGNAVVPLLPDLFGGAGTISWQAHLGGFLAGLFLVPLFERRPREQGT